VKFGPVAIHEAEGAILAHAVSAGTLRLRKAHRVTAADIAALVAAGISEIIVARLEPGDLAEDDAAERLARALPVVNVDVKAPSTGRVNLHAGSAGVFRVDRAMIDTINRLDPSVTIATIDNYATVQSGQMVATVKIIPFAVPGDVVASAEAIAGESDGLAVQAFTVKRVAMIQTVLPNVKPTVLDKTVRITEERLARSGGAIVAEKRVPHETETVARSIQEAGATVDLIIVFGASAVSDPDDVIPAAIRLAGGLVERVGMPVDPGNLLVLGSLGTVPVIGAPGCARSPKVNGFDWVLDRLCAGLAVTDAEISGMGVGGLLMEIPTRPQPREGRRQARHRGMVAALLLAAGRSSRMGSANKLLAEFDGIPLVRRSAETLLAAGLPVTVVVGHQAGRLRDALEGLDVAIVENPDYADGLSTSIRAGVAMLPDEADGVLIALADMPAVDADAIGRLSEAFSREGGTSVVRATHGGVRGNPVILPKSLFPAALRLEGDVGARHLVETGGVPVRDVEIGAAASVDVDTPEAMADAGGRLAG
jgi:molybdenum cofactor cytidylyltransferase